MTRPCSVEPPKVEPDSLFETMKRALKRLQEVQFESIANPLKFLEEVKNLSQEILPHLEANPQASELTTVLECTLVEVSRCYGASFLYFNVDDLGTMVKELINGGSSAFNRKTDINTLVHEDQTWNKYNIYKTNLHRKCVSALIKQMALFPTTLKTKKMPFIADYFKTLFFIDDCLTVSKLISLAEQLLSAFESHISALPKDQLIEATNQPLKVAIDYFAKILRVTYDSTHLKDRIFLLMYSFSLSLLQQDELSKKIAGITAINRGCYDMAYMTPRTILQSSLVNWLVDHNVFSLIFLHNFEPYILEQTGEIMRLFINNKKLTLQQCQVFYNLLGTTSAEKRKLMLRVIEPWRLDSQEKELLLNVIAQPRPLQFYNEDLFYYLQGLSRYLLIAAQADRLTQLLKEIIRREYNQMGYINRLRLLECYTTNITYKLKDKYFRDKIDLYLRALDDYLDNPLHTEFVMARALMQSVRLKFDSHELDILSQEIIEKNMFINRVLQVFALDTVHYKSDLIALTNKILEQYNACYEAKGFPKETILAAVKTPEIFQRLIERTDIETCKELIGDMTNMLEIEEYSFECVRIIFERLNKSSMVGVKKEITNRIVLYVVNSDPTSFFGMDIIKHLAFNSKFAKTRQSAAELISFTYTNWSESFRPFGELLLKDYLQQFVRLAQAYYSEYLKDQEQYRTKMHGVLQLAQQLLLATEHSGVGTHKAHNSLVPTYTTRLKIYNNTTHGDDVLTIFQKNLPSNYTVFEVIVEVAKQFKIDPHEIGLELQDSVPIKYNGLTLQELKLNKEEINAYRLPQSRAVRKPMIVDNELSEPARKAFTEIFNLFTSNGRMGKNEGAKFIEVMTQTSCNMHDSRLIELFNEYDLDGDGEMVADDFLRFYRDKLLDPYKYENVEKNLITVRYRKDLKRYDQPLEELNEELLCRYHLCKNEQFYSMLFDLTKHSDPLFCGAAQGLLARLPTYPKMIDSLHKETLSLVGRTPFESEYILVAIQSMLTTTPLINQFITLNNHLIIFEHLHASLPKRCIALCLHILRTLMPCPSLKAAACSPMKEESRVAMCLPPTNLFYEMMKSAIGEGDLAMLEPVLVLQLTQTTLPLDWVEGAAFHHDRDIRLLTCNFLYYWQLKTHFALDVFSFNVRQYNNKEWFALLADVVQVDTTIHLHSLLQAILADLQHSKEQLDGRRFDTTIHGNLNLIKQILNKTTVKEELNTSLNTLSNNIISNDNRKLLYDIRIQINPELLSEYLLVMGRQEVIKETDLRSSHVGLYNLGSICYMNSILQQFYMVEQLRNAILNAETPYLSDTIYEDPLELREKSFKDDFLYQLQDMYAHLQWSQKKYYHPKVFCLTLKDTTGRPINTAIQEDAHQFLNTAFAKLEKYLKRESSNVVGNIFGGTTVAEIICLNCKNKIEKEEEFYHLSLELQNVKEVHESLKRFTAMEQIEGYTCEVCKVKVDKITKQTFIKKVPKILIMNLMRITFDYTTLIRKKVHSALGFPIELLLNEYVHNSEAQNLRYRLKGVVIHSGTAEAGHYFSLIREGAKWYKFDDQNVSAFDFNDLPKVAFGGETESSNWANYESMSTNAYILFYEQWQEMEAETAPPLGTGFRAAVERENEQLYRQVQVCQPSYFEAVMSLKASKNAFELHLQAVRILQTYYTIDNSLILALNHNILPMLKEEANWYSFLRMFGQNMKKYFDVICFHKEKNVQQLYQTLLNQTIKIKYSENRHFQELPVLCKQFSEYFEERKLNSFIYKSYHFFEFWKQLCFNKQMALYLAEQHYFEKLLDVLFGSKSTITKNRSDIQFSQGIPIRSLVMILLEMKVKRLIPNRPLSEQTESFSKSEISVLQDMVFLKKMVSVFDVQFVSPMVCLSCRFDESFSRKTAKMLLTEVNDYENIDRIKCQMQLIKAFLCIEDHLSRNRREWMLGIPQLADIGHKVYGLQFSYESTSYHYISALFYGQGEQYAPLLETVFQKRKYLNGYTAHGIKAILELSLAVPAIFDYIYSLPAPYYLAKTYFDWVESYVVRLRTECHYSLQGDRMALAADIERMLIQHQTDYDLLKRDLPVNKLIIGKNHTITQVQFLNTEAYFVLLEANSTYHLPNLPLGQHNEALPRDIFSFAAQDHTIQKYFVKNRETHLQQVDIDHSKTILVFSFTCNQPIRIQFTLNAFAHTLHMAKGLKTVVTPYQPNNLAQLIQVTLDENTDLQIQKKIQIKVTDIETIDWPDNNQGTIQCPFCETHNLLSRMDCQACDQPLFK